MWSKVNSLVHILSINANYGKAIPKTVQLCFHVCAFPITYFFFNTFLFYFTQTTILQMEKSLPHSTPHTDGASNANFETEAVHRECISSSCPQPPRLCHWCRQLHALRRRRKRLKEKIDCPATRERRARCILNLALTMYHQR